YLEKKQGQRFFIDLEMECNIEKACVSDRLNETVNYAKVFDRVKSMVEGQRFELIEALGHRIALSLLYELPNIEKVSIAIRKNPFTIRGSLDCIQVMLVRTREDLSKPENQSLLRQLNRSEGSEASLGKPDKINR
ncbi:MAG: dihydroneopterin aldolase, partial [Thermoplasmata archaeon]